MGNTQVNLEEAENRTSLLREGNNSENIGNTDSEEVIWEMLQRASVPPERIMELVRKKPKPQKKGQATIYDYLGD